jgi:hypothetical protein
MLALVVASSALPGGPTLTLSPSTLPSWTQAVPYSQTITASGGTSPYSFSLLSGTLPTGLTLASGGALTGTPTAAGTFSFTVSAADAGTGTGSQAYSVTISAPLDVAQSSLPGGTAGTGYSQTLTATGGTGSKTWSVSLGSLPPGLTMSSGGVVSGTPTAAGTFGFTAQVTDGVGATGTQALSITVAIAIAPTSLPGVTIGRSYTRTLTPSGGTPAYVFSLASGSSLPSGLTLSTGGVISGTTFAVGTSSFTVQVADSGTGAGSRTYSLTVNNIPVITTSSLAGSTVGSAYSKTVTGTSGTTPYAWNISSGSLPGGLSLNGSTGVISGTPTTAGTSSFTIRLTDANSADVTKALSIVVAAKPSITTSALPAGTVGQAYSSTLVATGGTPPLAWSVTSGALPAGLALNGSTGVLSGTPTTAGTANVTVQVKDANGSIATKAFTLTVSAAVAPPPAPVPPPPSIPGREPCTICGTARDDVLVGTPGRDVFYGLGGNDVIHGFGGNDVIYGDAGADKLYGGPGNDTIEGGKGNDLVQGDGGADRLTGGKGKDRVLGGKGADTLNTKDRNRDLVKGGPGRDRGRVDTRLDSVTGVESFS